MKTQQNVCFFIVISVNNLPGENIFYPSVKTLNRYREKLFALELSITAVVSLASFASDSTIMTSMHISRGI